LDEAHITSSEPSQLDEVHIASLKPSQLDEAHIASLNGLLQHSLQKARENGVPGADTAKIIALVVTVPYTNAEAVQVHITGPNEDQLDALWREHIKPMATRLLTQLTWSGGEGTP
jgi:hypothetical protein